MGLHDRPGIVELISSRYGLREDTTKGWLASTTFAPRQAVDPDMDDKILATLEDAGFLAR